MTQMKMSFALLPHLRFANDPLRKWNYLTKQVIYARVTDLFEFFLINFKQCYRKRCVNTVLRGTIATISLDI